MCTYLSKRGSTYYFRRVVPVELRQFLGGRREWMLSLGTKDREAAKRLLPKHTVATDAEIDAATGSLANLSLKAPEKPAQRVSESVALLEQRMFERSLEGAEFEAERDAREADDGEQVDARLRGAGAHREPELREIVRLRAELGNAEERVRRYRPRNYVSADSVNPTAVQPEPAPSPTALGVLLHPTIVDRWAAERSPAKKTQDLYASIAREFYQRLGQIPVASITRKDVLAFKDQLREAGQSIANTNVKLSRIATLLQWAADNELAEENVAKGIVIKDTDKGRNKRREFDLASLNRIFGGSVYAQGARPSRGKGEAAYWLPLLALFTGGRLEELGQLRPSDVAEIDYPDASGAQQRAWFIRLRRDDADAMTLKNAGSERDVPVHPQLVRLGFLEYVAAARAAEHDRLFPGLKANKYGDLTPKWGEWFSFYLRGECKVTDRRTPFHAFRHTFKQYARLAGIIEGVQRQIMGHSSGDVADEYGSGYPLHQIVEGMRMYRVPGLKLSLAGSVVAVARLDKETFQ